LAGQQTVPQATVPAAQGVPQVPSGLQVTFSGQQVAPQAAMSAAQGVPQLPSGLQGELGGQQCGPHTVWPGVQNSHTPGAVQADPGGQHVVTQSVESGGHGHRHVAGSGGCPLSHSGTQLPWQST
jgi:hypothetical protein